MKSLESQVVLAIQAFKNCDFTSIRACAKAYNVPIRRSITELRKVVNLIKQPINPLKNLMIFKRNSYAIGL
jgi:hypothetical protein